MPLKEEGVEHGFRNLGAAKRNAQAGRVAALGLPYANTVAPD